MKISKYTYCLKVGKNNYILFSTLSNALIGIDKEIYQYLTKCQRQHCAVSIEVLGEDLFSVLQDKHMITDNDLDETLIFKSFIQNMRMDHQSMHLTIAPTMDCIFRCHYCFEHSKSRSYMSSETIDAIINYVTKSQNLKQINLTWFGGEPLMATEQMLEFYNKLRANFPHKVVSNIITTGFHLTDETIQLLKSIEISSMQITLDGKKESHNNVKYLQGHPDVFTTIINNVEKLTSAAPDIRIVFRINLTKQNKNEYVDLHRFLREKFKNRNVSVAPGFVMNRQIGQSNTDGDIYFSRKESSEFVLDLFHRYKIHSPWLRYPQSSCNECAIRNKNSIAFDADGYAYKCWEIIGNKKYSIGKISPECGLTEQNNRILNRQLYGADPLCDKKCAKCRLLPICYGGCPIQRIQNEYEGYHNEICTPYKDYLPKYLAINLLYKNAGLQNY